MLKKSANNGTEEIGLVTPTLSPFGRGYPTATLTHLVYTFKSI